MFNPRLRLDLSSGSQSVRRLRESVDELSGSQLGVGPGLPQPEGAGGRLVGGGAVPAVAFERAIALMQNKHTQGLHERHVASLRKICRLNAGGFFVHDLSHVAMLLEGAATHMRAGVPEYAAGVCELLGILALPFQKQKCYDDHRYERDTSALVRAVSSLLRLSMPAVTVAAAEMLLQLVTPAAGAGSALRPGTAAPSALRAFAYSGAMQNVMAALDAPPGAPLVASVRLLRQLSRTAELGAQILRDPHMGSLIKLLHQPLDSTALPLAVETLWNLLEASPFDAAAALAQPAVAELLGGLLERLVFDGKADRELRNELLVVGALLASGAEETGRAALVEGGWLRRTLGMLGQEVTRTASHARDGHPQTASGAPSAVDFEELQLLFHFLLAMTSGALPETASAELHAASVEHMLVQYLSPDDEDSHRWSRSQRVDLAALALKLLSNLVTHVPDALAEANAAPQLVSLIRAERHPQLRDGALALLVQALLYDSGRLHAALVAEDMLPLLITLASGAAPLGLSRAARGGVGGFGFGGPTLLNAGVGSNTVLRRASGVDATALRDVLLVMSLLCQDDAGCREAFGAHGGVNMLLPLLHEGTEPQMLLAAIDTLWSAVVPSAHLLAHFVDEGGVLRLLSALEAAPFAPRAHLLSCLADTLAHAPAAAQCHEWRGSKGQRALGLLLSLWAEEEARLGAASNNGMLASAQRPLEVSGGQMLRSLQQSLHSDDSDDEVAASGGAGAGGQLGGREAAESLRLTTMAGLSIAGRFDGVGTKEAAPLESHDLRAKVYAAMAALDFGEAAEGGDLDSAQALTLAAVKEYVAFCEAETWRDIAEELDAESTRPITADGERLDRKLDLAESRAHDVIATQRAHAQRIYAGGDALQEAMLSRIRVLRDGPMAGMGRSAKRAGVSLFRARLEAKNRIGEMVAASRREYTGPKPTAIEYVDAVLEQQLEAVQAEAAATAAAAAAASAAAAQRNGFKSVDGATARPAEDVATNLKSIHVPFVLRTLASSIGADPGRVTAFLREFRIPDAPPPAADDGRTADGRAAGGATPPVSLRVEIGEPHAGVTVRMAMFDPEREVKYEEMHSICTRLLEFLQYS